MSDLLSKTASSYGWDQADRLISATNGITASSYAYNGDGLRMSKTVSGTTEAFVWDTAEGLPLILQDGATRYVTGPDGLPIEQIDGSGTVLYYYRDQLGSTRGLLNSARQVVASYWYDAYGTRHVVSGTATMTPFGYAGQYTDAETGWQYLQARYYDPATSQFVSVDPLVQQTGQPYAYAADDPLNYLDPTGLGKCSLWPGDWGSCVSNLWNAAKQATKQSVQAYVQAHQDAYQGPGYNAFARYLWPGLPSSTTPESSSSSQSPSSAPVFACPNGTTSLLTPGFGSVQVGAGSGQQAPDYVVDPNGNVIPVPNGASGPYPVESGKGFRYEGGAGGSWFSKQTAGVRIMDPTQRYPGGYVNYSNGMGQSINQYTGRTIDPSDPMWHQPIDLNPPIDIVPDIVP